jgi:hypothetical protein
MLSTNWRRGYEEKQFCAATSALAARRGAPGCRSGGVALNQLINVAVAEKLSALRTEKHFAERARRASVPKALAILKRAGVGNPPMKGDKMRRSSKEGA